MTDRQLQIISAEISFFGTLILAQFQTGILEAFLYFAAILSLVSSLGNSWLLRRARRK